MPRVSDEQVFNATIALIQRDGYAGATTEKIAQAAGIHEVTLFRRYQSKAGLLAKAMEREAEQFGGPRGVRRSGNLQADLKQVLTAYSKLLQRRGPLLPILMAELPRHPELAPILKYPHSILDNIASLIRSYQKIGRLTREDPMLSVCALVAPMILPSILGRCAPSSLRGELDLDAHLRAFLHGRLQPDTESAESPAATKRDP